MYISATNKRRKRQVNETRVYVRLTRKLYNDVYHLKRLLSGVILVKVNEYCGTGLDEQSRIKQDTYRQKKKRRV